MKLYTKTGDDGFTQQPGGQRVGKDSPCIEAVGSIDELSAQIGLCFQAAEQAGQVEIAEVLAPLQAELFGVGALLSTAEADVKPSDPAVERMERQIDAMCAELLKLASFILPGGCKLACRLHAARAVCRRAERRVVALAQAGAKLPPVVLRYFNRLGDLLFAAARMANHNAGVEEAVWKP
ncbi:MAG: cob(I)yrinic acid a,c-diamide adenosyltransferase [Planctomycetota bacterium]|nr:cob(I)yrinic acid a,c-diamide adenosyltransferase [Planctomycetota bacterium]